MSGLTIRRRILGVDFGSVRIGIAVSDELGLLAHPVETVPAGRGAAERIDEIAREKEVERVVVGLPRQMNGVMGTAANEVLQFVAKLRQRLSCEVVTWDERLTTSAANRALREGGQETKRSRKFVDQVAAQVILQGYLDQLNLSGGLGSEQRPAND